MPIRNIIFDLGGVLLNIDYQATINAFKDFGVSNFDQLFAQASQEDLFDRIEKGKITSDKFRDELRRITGLPLTDEAIDQAWNAMLLDLPWHRLDLLDGVKAHYRTFLLSNTNAIHISVFHDYLYRTYGLRNLESYFEKQYFSHEIGMHKPDREPFDLVVRENQLLPEETLFIDDSKQHLAGARAAGIRAFWLDTTSMQITDLFTWKYLLRPEVIDTNDYSF